jgi:hypothetical protein
VAKTNYQGPGAWAAQGAAWSKTPGAPAAGAPPNLTGHAVAGSVMLAAAKSAPKAPAIQPPSLQAPAAPAMPKAPAMPTAPKVPSLQKPQVAMPKAPAVSPPSPPSPPPAPLAQRVETAKIHQPFIDMGHGIASGQHPFI